MPAFRVVPGPVSVAATVPSGARRWRMPAIAAALVVIVAAGGLAWWQPWVTREEPASVERMAFPLPDKPSIAVLPFANLSGDPEQDYLGDGIAENITTALSRLPDMFVIARTSTLAYKGKPVKVQQVAEELGIRYVLEGSVQRSGDQVRVTAQLIDALSGLHLWAESYDRELKDALALQDDITLNVIVALEVTLTEGGGARIQRGNTDNPEAYQLIRRALPIFRRTTREGNIESRRLAEQAIELDPNYTLAWFLVGNSHFMSVFRGWSEDPARDGARAEELAQKILKLDEYSAPGYVLLSNVSLLRKRYDEAINYQQKAHDLAPNSAIIAGLLGFRLIRAGRPEEALPIIQRGIRLSPNALPNVLMWEGHAYYAMGRYEEAIASFERGREIGPKSLGPVAWLALTYAEVSRMDEARAVAQDLLKLSPSFSAKGWLKSVGFFAPPELNKRIATLRQIGLQE